ncbi:hypothetical protein ABQW55_004090 [Xanthomonas citri pv. malvacearum]|nr:MULTISPECIES: hypothetical protein [Xanthomonas]MBE0316161.1 hypothetical protein [Xanthomonas citri pv. punicae]MDS0801218.1 hypothetical protein [Xanthomonas citri pv. punicae]MDS0841639.1 hypothetical protein [Xanthomonas citri pv. punicae]WAW87823.1 hypothetical protein LPY96_04815 [Xanthomonas citri pv. malvacearum]WAW96118.1 hypothetical protein LGM68_04085 [Xanthomonas citri pv. malvacearum]
MALLRRMPALMVFDSMLVLSDCRMHLRMERLVSRLRNELALLYRTAW